MKRLLALLACLALLATPVGAQVVPGSPGSPSNQVLSVQGCAGCVPFGSITTLLPYNGSFGLTLNASSFGGIGGVDPSGASFNSFTSAASATTIPLGTGGFFPITGSGPSGTVPVELPYPVTVGGSVAVSNTNANGANTSANSQPVVIASDQAFGGHALTSNYPGDSNGGAYGPEYLVFPFYTGSGSSTSFNLQRGADSSAAINVAASATTTQVIALAASEKIYVMGYNFTLSGTTSPTAKFVYGTGTNCGSGTTALTGLYAAASNSFVQVNSSAVNGPQFIVPAGNALCITTGGTAPSAGGVVTFSQAP